MQRRRPANAGRARDRKGTKFFLNRKILYNLRSLDRGRQSEITEMRTIQTRWAALAGAASLASIPWLAARSPLAAESERNPSHSRNSEATTAASALEHPLTAPVEIDIGYPHLACSLRSDAAGEDPAQALRLFSDDDGIVHFYAARAAAANETSHLTLECERAGEVAISRGIDLHAPSTFEPPVVHVSPTAFFRRPLRGDPMSYTRRTLLENGYGLRPDPAGAPDLYARWLALATRPMRRLDPVLDPGSSPQYALPIQYTDNSAIWSGMLLSASGVTYAVAYSNFNVPVLYAQSGTTHSSGLLWAGLGGLSSPLIQDGLSMDVNGSTATYAVWIEYCCGNNTPLFKVNNFPVSADDEVFAQAWACDGQGNINAGGGFGCFYLADSVSGAYTQCWSSTTPCGPYGANSTNGIGSLPQPQAFTGATSEFELERLVPTPIAHFNPVAATFSAEDTNGGIHDVLTDPVGGSPIVRTNAQGNPTSPTVNLNTLTIQSPNSVSLTWIQGS